MSFTSDNGRLTEEFVQDSFHSYLKSRFALKFVAGLLAWQSLNKFHFRSLTQASVEKLLDADILASAEGDLMITGA